jgi:hypothetical protein
MGFNTDLNLHPLGALKSVPALTACIREAPLRVQLGGENPTCRVHAVVGGMACAPTTRIDLLSVIFSSNY